MTRTATRTWRLALLGALGALACTLLPSGASAYGADPCARFTGGCPPFSDPRKPPEFAGQVWVIKSARTDNLVIQAAGRSVGLEPKTERSSQKFRIMPSESAGVYLIQKVVNPLLDARGRQTRMCLSGDDTGREGVIVKLDPCEQDKAQFWKIEAHPKGFFRIRRSTGAGRCLDAHTRR